MSNYVPELGQACFGNPFEPYGCPDYVEALLAGILREAERVYWNRQQADISLGSNNGDNGEDFAEVFGPEMTYRAYYWSIDDYEDSSPEQQREMDRPNLAYDGVELRWNKYFGRGMSLNCNKSHADWVEWFDKAMSFIRSRDVQH